jgi:hypothetical protein
MVSTSTRLRDPGALSGPLTGPASLPAQPAPGMTGRMRDAGGEMFGGGRSIGAARRGLLRRARWVIPPQPATTPPAADRFGRERSSWSHHGAPAGRTAVDRVALYRGNALAVAPYEGRRRTGPQERIAMPTIHCSVCDLTGTPASAPEAEHWVAIHDQLQHRGQPTAAILTRRWPRSRNLRAAVTSWPA